MKNFPVIFLILFAAVILPSGDLSAQTKPIQLALFNPVQLVPEGQSISALRLNLIYSKNANVNGVDLGLVNVTTGDQLGIQLGGVGYNYGHFTGVQWNFVSIAKGNFTGLQAGFVNYNSTNVNGLQFALVNYAATLKGLQLGLINIIGKGGFLPVFPIFNFDFN